MPPRTADELIVHLAHDRGLDLGRSEALTHPKAFSDMARACERIERAIEGREKVGIFGDYDCDGVTATALLVRLLHSRGVDPYVRLPHREHDGYGLNPSIVEEIIKADVDLLLTVDTGITAVKEARLLKKNGIDMIVTDHHKMGEELPSAFALLHPGLVPGYPEPHPAGAGVAYKLVQAMEGEEWKDMETDKALAMIGTVADVVELRGDNRRLVQEGLEALGRIKTGPLARLCKMAKPAGDISSTDVAFRIAPRINAAGRMADPNLALDALLNGGLALQKLNSLNALRQEETDAQLAHALERVDPSQSFLVVTSEQFDHGIVGLLAGRITERTGKPSLIAKIEDGVCTGSLRSPKCYDVYTALKRTEDLLIRFGGHAQAAGCTFEERVLPELTKILNADITKQIDVAQLAPTLHVDGVLTPRDITLGFCKKLGQLEPFGAGNPEPQFLLQDVQLEWPRLVGSEEAHLQAHIAGYKSIGFNLGNLIEHTKEKLDVVCRLGIDSWGGNETPQIIIDDVRSTQAPDYLPSETRQSPARQKPAQS